MQGQGDMGYKNLGTQGSGNSGRHRDSGMWDIGAQGCDKQTTPNFCTEFVIKVQFLVL